MLLCPVFPWLPTWSSAVLRECRDSFFLGFFLRMTGWTKMKDPCVNVFVNNLRRRKKRFYDASFSIFIFLWCICSYVLLHVALIPNTDTLDATVAFTCIRCGCAWSPSASSAANSFISQRISTDPHWEPVAKQHFFKSLLRIWHSPRLSTSLLKSPCGSSLSLAFLQWTLITFSP